MWATAKYSATWGIRQLPGMCWHPAKRMGGKAHEPGWHREEFSSLAERGIFLPGTFCFCKGEGKMKFSPPIEEVKALTARGEYKVAPISCEILSDICTPIEAMQILKNVSTHCYLLESAQANEKWGRYTFLGYDPKMEITCVNGTLRAGDVTLHTDDPSAVLRDILARYKSPHLPGLPTFTGGLVGYFSYDYLGYREPKARTDAQDTENFKDVDLMLFDKVIAFDNLR